MQLLQPQEVEVFYLLPAIRKALASAMLATGKSQKAVASLLGVTPAAISQYMHEKRASAPLPESFMAEATSAALAITDTQTMVREVQRLLALARETKLVCQLHAHYANVPHACEACFK